MEGTVGAKAVDMARKAAPALKRAGRAGNVLSFGISAHEQWEKDSHDPSTGDGEKVARATTRGLGSAAGGWAGGLAGAKVGARSVRASVVRWGRGRWYRRRGRRLWCRWLDCRS